jgi:hypothetical protein
VALGQQALWLQTYGQRFTDPAHGRSFGAPKLAPDHRPKVTATIPDTPNGMPESISYDEATRILHIGTGRIEPVVAGRSG